jgi:hypothetical protein
MWNFGPIDYDCLGIGWESLVIFENLIVKLNISDVFCISLDKTLYESRNASYV